MSLIRVGRCAFCHKPSDEQCCATCCTLHWENVAKEQQRAAESYRRDVELGA